MKKNRLTRQVIRIVILLLISIVLLILLIATIIPRPPAEEFKAYHVIINQYELNECTDENNALSHAQFFREAAYNEWQVQNEKCILKRDYNESKRMILIAISFAEEAKKNMNTGKLNNSNIHKELANNNLIRFDQRVLKSYPKWEKWILEAISYSKQKNTLVLVIEKFNHRCLVFENGVMTDNFPIEMGINYLQDKQNEKDFATPEGVYYITSKKTGLDTSNYKSLILNFPNKEDRSRLVNAFKNQTLSNLEALEYKLSIHGHGGKGYDWTDGSIALTNKDMDILFENVKIGTKVIIVGSVKDTLTIKN